MHIQENTHSLVSVSSSHTSSARGKESFHWSACAVHSNAKLGPTILPCSFPLFKQRTSSSTEIVSRHYFKTPGIRTSQLARQLLTLNTEIKFKHVSKTYVLVHLLNKMQSHGLHVQEARIHCESPFTISKSLNFKT